MPWVCVFLVTQIPAQSNVDWIHGICWGKCEEGNGGLVRASSTPTIKREYVKKKKEKKEVLKDVFDRFDADKDGRISSKELMDYLASVGESVTHKVAERVIREFDSDGDELLEYGDFVRLIEEEDNDESSWDDVLRTAFHMFEADKGCGYITPKGLQQMLRRLGDVKSHHECAAMIRVFDLDGNGFLDFHEFHQMMSPPSFHF
ncbi:putative calcium-binding protein CML41 [Senna tora]|uniref:Putative calcium-binding protein CML41 n=1 Tax=Senna tora TaxID=362788 RepID=A0A834U0D8_9FABA|nr:putative calcium-binding protein CML41 [Senna tora]